MASIDDSKPPGWYYVGYVAQASLDSMPNEEMRKRFPLNHALSNTTPYRSATQARVMAKAHKLRDITIHKN